jgi:HNH endonuclease
VTITSDKSTGHERSARSSIPKSLRFEVFKRDSFTCQYCGRRAPDVILHCDHVKAIAEGGTTDILNLVTACIDCNLGKGARKLCDNAALTKQLNQLAVLQEKREQIDMMLAWRDELNQLDEIPPLELAKRWSQLTGCTFSETGKKTIKKLIKRFGFDEVAAAMNIAADQYLERDGDGNAIFESALLAFDRIGGIAKVEQLEKREPGARKIFYIRGILRNRLSYCPEWKALAVIRDANKRGVPLEIIEQLAKEARSWTNFCELVEKITSEVIEQTGWYERWREGMLDELTKLFGPENAVFALDKISAAMSIGISQDYMLNIARSEMVRLSWDRYQAWLDYMHDNWVRFICPLQNILMETVPTEKALDIFCMIYDLHYPLEPILTAARQLKSWARLEPWIDEKFSALMEIELREIGYEQSGAAAPPA